MFLYALRAFLRHVAHSLEFLILVDRFISIFSKRINPMKKRSKAKGAKRPLFSPSSIATVLNDALKRDLAEGQNVYGFHTLASAYYRRIQSDKFLSKFVPPECDTSPLEGEAFDKFLDINKRMFDFNQGTKYPTHLIGANGYPKLNSQDASPREQLLLRARLAMYYVLTDLTEDEWFQECQHSSGSTLGVPFRDTSMERKSTFPISSTRSCVPQWKRYLAYDHEMAKAVAQYNESHIGDHLNIVEASRATTVDKTTNSRRMIAIEPTVNMFFQQGLMTAMVKRLQYVGIDLASAQAMHKRLARESSNTERWATIDFSSASDCVSTELLRWLLPPKWFGRLMMTRTPRMNIRGNNIELFMVSTMGNATTFPVETLVFWSLAIAVVSTERLGRKNVYHPNKRDMASVFVYGDDCILPNHLASEFMELSESVGFIVNREKSFFGNEHFRESCGGDYLHGFDVRPFFLKAPSGSRRSLLEPWLYTIGNGILQQYIKYFGTLTYVYDKALWQAYFEIFRRYKLKVRVVPPWYPDDSGLKIGNDLGRFQRQYDIPLQEILYDKHGTFHFTYLRFVFRESKQWYDPLRYSTWLKFPKLSRRPFDISKRSETHVYNSR
jgi:hypothetical protein